MRKLGLLATVAVLSLAGATAGRAESVIVQEPVGAAIAAPGQQVVTERVIEPGLFGDQFVRERTIVTQPMVTEQTVVAPTVVAPAPRAAIRTIAPAPRYSVTQPAPVYQSGVTTVVSEPAYGSYYRPAYWNDYGYMPTERQCTVGIDGFQRCY